MKVDLLVFGAHPDDVELGAGGTVALHAGLGKKVGIIDLTRGELGTRGNVELRNEEAVDSSTILNVICRENLNFKDGFFENDEGHLIKIIEMIRNYQPSIVICNAEQDRHPDHGRSAKLVSRACFLSGLRKIETLVDGKAQAAWRPQAVYHYIQDRYTKPDFVIDISSVIEKKIASIKAFKSQFYDPESKEPETPISGKEFIDFQYSRCAEMGRIIGVKYGEGFTVERSIGVKSLWSIDY